MFAAAAAQQIYVSGSGPAPPLSCAQSQSFSGLHATPTPRPATNLSYTLQETTRTALSVIPTNATTSFGFPYLNVRTLLANVSTTSWQRWLPNATEATDSTAPYGQSAYNAMWERAGLRNFTTGLYSTTATPTPIPTSSLILPPPRYFPPPDSCNHFPNDFMLGVAGAAAQIEGAIAEEGRGPGFPDIIPNIASVEGSITAETLSYYGLGNDYVAIESYYLYKRDIDRIAAVGIKYYSFSIAWSRILPFALPGTPVNAQGIAHYDDLINYVIAKGMQPIVTLHHYDTPLTFYGANYTEAVQNTKLYMANWDMAFQNSTFQDAFVNYGKIVMTHFADRVPVWFTFNEPQFGIAGGAAADTVLKAHARLAHFYRDELTGTGKISLKLATAPGMPLDPFNQTHLEAVQHYDDLVIGTFYDPLILGKDYPEAFKMTIQDFVPLSEEDRVYLKGTVSASPPSISLNQTCTSTG
jgi:hypothetical protein